MGISDLPNEVLSQTLSPGTPDSLEKKVNILIVDDRPDKLLALQAILGSLNENLVIAKSGRDALRHLLHEDFAVILLDVNMPGLDGFDTAALIRQRARCEHVPILFITSMSDNENYISRGYSLGAVDFIVAPIAPEILRTKVSVFVDLYRKTLQIQIQAEKLRKIQEKQHQNELAIAATRIEMETQRNRFFTLAVDMLAIADFEGKLLQINPAWEKTLGYSDVELKARLIPDFATPEDKPSVLSHLHSLRESPIPAHFEGRYQCKDGSIRWLGWTAASFASEKLIYIFARDITVQKQAEKKISSLNFELEQRVSKLTEINQELEAFTYSVSHDLRAPLRAMQGFSQFLLEEYADKLDACGADYTRRIATAAHHMDILIQDLLEYSRLSRMELPLARIDLNHMMDEVIKHLVIETQSRNAVIEIDRPLPVVAAHASTLLQVISNLITNGIKFVEKGTQPKIYIHAEKHDQMVRLWVEDNGIGIAPDHQDRIFRIFERLHRIETYPGTGIGLAIVRKGIERMGGRSGLKSALGRGSQFWIELNEWREGIAAL